MITNEQKLAILQKAKSMSPHDKRIMMGVVFYLEQHPECTDIAEALRASQLECAIVMYRERWATGWTALDIRAITGIHKNTIVREIDRRGLSRTTDPSNLDYYKK